MDPEKGRRIMVSGPVAQGPTPPAEPAYTGPTGVVIEAECWSCGAPMRKIVRRQHRRHAHFSWSCAECDVAWAGPGVEVPA
jgi:hypothetical protein